MAGAVGVTTGGSASFAVHARSAGTGIGLTGSAGGVHARAKIVGATAGKGTPDGSTNRDFF